MIFFFIIIFFRKKIVIRTHFEGKCGCQDVATWMVKPVYGRQCRTAKMWPPRCGHQEVVTRTWPPGYGLQKMAAIGCDHQEVADRMWPPGGGWHYVATRRWLTWCGHQEHAVTRWNLYQIKILKIDKKWSRSEWINISSLILLSKEDSFSRTKLRKI